MQRGPIPTLWELQNTTPWVWLSCERCQHHAPLACAVAVIRRGADASTVTGCILRAVDPSKQTTNNKQTTSKADPLPILPAAAKSAYPSSASSSGLMAGVRSRARHQNSSKRQRRTTMIDLYVFWIVIALATWS